LNRAREAAIDDKALALDHPAVAKAIERHRWRGWPKGEYLAARGELEDDPLGIVVVSDTLCGDALKMALGWSGWIELRIGPERAA